MQKSFLQTCRCFHEVPDGHRHLNSDVLQPRLTIERYGTKQEKQSRSNTQRYQANKNWCVNRKYLIVVTGEERELSFGNDLMVH